MKTMLKFILKKITFIHALYYIILYKITIMKYSTVSMMISKITGKYGMYVREHYYTHTLSKCGVNLQVGYGAFIVYDDVEIGDNCAIEEYSIISKCTIGDNVIIAARCSIMSGGHHHDVDDLSKPLCDSLLDFKKVSLGNNLWIGTHAVIMNDISPGTVVGAGAVVTKKFPENTVIAGVPAKLVRTRGIR